MAGEGKPYGACRALRRKCMEDCLFAPYFSSDKIGEDQFSAILEVFGHSRLVKLLRPLPVDRRQDAVASILYEAQARILDPVHGCSSDIRALQQENEILRQQLAVSHAQLAERRSLAVASQNIHIDHTCFPMCMERGCMRSDFSNLYTVQQIDAWKSTQERQTNFIINPDGGGVQARTGFPSFPEVHNLHF